MQLPNQCVFESPVRSWTLGARLPCVLVHGRPRCSPSIDLVRAQLPVSKQLSGPSVIEACLWSSPAAALRTALSGKLQAALATAKDVADMAKGEEQSWAGSTSALGCTLSLPTALVRPQCCSHTQVGIPSIAKQIKASWLCCQVRSMTRCMTPVRALLAGICNGTGSRLRCNHCLRRSRP